MRISGEFIRYCLVGLVNTIAGISTAYIILNILNQSYLISATGAYIVGICVSFYLNKIFTFKYCEDVSCVKLFCKFVITMLPSYVIAYFLGWLIARFITFTPILYGILSKIANLFSIPEAKLSDNFAVLVSMVIYLLLGFAVNKYFVFKKNKPQN